MRTIPSIWSAVAALGVLALVSTLVPTTARAANYVLNNINPGGSANPTNFATLNGVTYFVAFNSSVGRELWRTDGTSAGTSLVKDITTGTGHTFNTTNDSYSIVPMDGNVYFKASSNQHLYKSDGTAANTADLTPSGSMTGASAALVPLNGLLYFVGFSNSTGNEISRTDGTVAGTYIIADLNGGTANSGASNLSAVGSSLLFTTTQTGYFWKTQGTLATTTPIGPLSTMTRPVVLGNVLYFIGRRSGTGIELMRSDGTDAGTVVVKKFGVGNADGNVTDLTVVGNTLYFLQNGTDIYKSDGTTAGTVKVKTLSTNDWPISSLTGNAAAGSTLLYFRYGVAATGVELWVTDGTDAGTHLVKDIRPGSNSSGADLMTRVGDRLYFRASDGTNSNNIWKTDGTEANTVRIADTSPENLYFDGVGSLYFSDYVVDVPNNLIGWQLSKYTIPTAELPVVATPLTAWRQTAFGSTADSGDGANSADPDHDGIPNLLEFAMGTDPKAGTVGNAATVSGVSVAGRGVVVPGVSGGAVAHVIFSRRKDLASSSLTATPKFSTDLVTWAPATATPVVVSSDAEKEVLSVDVPVAMQSSARVFFQLGVQ